MRSQFTALRVHPRTATSPPTTMAADTGLKTTVRLGKIRWRIEHDYRELKTGHGLDHFEGRSCVPCRAAR
jgi:SRSO17 transposase